MNVDTHAPVRLDGRVAVITGAARGQGAVTAELFLERGACVLLVDRDEDEVEATTARLASPERAAAAAFDVSEPEGWREAVELAAATFGQPTVLVNNAALYRPRPLTDIDPADFLEHYRVNVLGALLGMQAVEPGMTRAGGGSIVNISAVGGIRGYTGIASYSSSKWALRGLTRVSAKELGPSGIRVNTIIPGLIETRMTAHNSVETNGGYISATPLGRIGRSDEVAQVSAFLASDASSFVTGAELVVDGGLTLA